MWVRFRLFFRQSLALTVANLKCRYRRTIAGFLWVIFCPLTTLGVQALVFGRFLNVRSPNYSLFLISGLVPWIFVSQTLEMTTPILVNHGSFIKSFQASPLIYLSAQFFDNLLNFVFTFLVVLGPLVFITGEWKPQWLLLPLPVFALALGVFAFSLMLATLQVFFRDVRFVIGFALQMGYFLTPIFYPLSYVPERWRVLVGLNPFYLMIHPFQILLCEGSLGEFQTALLESAGVAVLLLGGALLIWRSRKPVLYLYV